MREIGPDRRYGSGVPMAVEGAFVMLRPIAYFSRRHSASRHPGFELLQPKTKRALVIA